jgi:hypothetical protein
VEKIAELALSIEEDIKTFNFAKLKQDVVSLEALL